MCAMTHESREPHRFTFSVQRHLHFYALPLAPSTMYELSDVTRTFATPSQLRALYSKEQTRVPGLWCRIRAMSLHAEMSLWHMT